MMLNGEKRLSVIPGPGLGKSGQAVDRDNVDPVLNSEVWFGRGRHPRLHSCCIHNLLPHSHLRKFLVDTGQSSGILSLETENKNKNMADCHQRQHGEALLRSIS